MTLYRLTHSIRPFTLAVCVALVTAGQADASDSSGKLDATLAQSATQLLGRSRVIVEFNGAPDVRVFGRGTTSRRLGSQTYVADVDNRLLAALAADVRIKRVVIDRLTVATLERTGAAVGAATAREDFGLSGRNVGIAVIDSGITSLHNDLHFARNGRRTERVAHFRDFTAKSSSGVWASETPADPYGHGTHVAGIIAGNGYESRGARRGIAPNATLVGLKVLDGDGHGYISDVIAAIDYAISIRRNYNIRVINLSVASAVTESYLRDPLTLAAKRAVDAGIVVVTAAGNLGLDAKGDTQFGGVTSPGNAPWVLTVGAASHQGTARRADDIVAGFSSRGPTWIDFVAKPDIVAPGVGTESLSDPHSSLYAALPEYLLNGVYTTWYKPYLSLTGTSMAAPVVTGTIALMLEANPKLTPNAVKAILQYTAQVRDDVNVLAQGAGSLNARGAVRLARFFASPEDRLGVMADTIERERIKWAQHILWGNYLVTGGVPLPGSNAWDRQVTWGAMSTSDGRPVVWGAQDEGNIVWSTGGDGNIVWSTGGDGNIVWSTGGDGNIVWSTDGDGNIVWSTNDDRNIVWSTAIARNVVWGADCGGRNCGGVIWGTKKNGVVWGATDEDANIVWSTDGDGNIVWSTNDDGNIVWSTYEDGNIVWSTRAVERVVWPATSR
jgi:serine protease AprX